MTIRDMEEKTGISRANIRYYEAEGLLHPEREANGYRNYSEADAAILLKIKLLRAMDVSLAAVKEVAAGSKPLELALSELDAQITAQQSKQERVRLIISRMHEDFDSLEPEGYLAMLESGEPAWKEDAPPRLNLPWRRYWARCLDFSVYNTLVAFLLRDFQNNLIYIPIGTLFAMLLIEPALLSMFGTTLGKAIFGIRVTDLEGGKLSYATALERTWTVLWEGEALRIPLLCLYFRYKSLDLAEQEIPLSWESESELTYRDDKLWRYGLYALAVLADIAMTLWLA